MHMLVCHRCVRRRWLVIIACLGNILFAVGEPQSIGDIIGRLKTESMTISTEHAIDRLQFYYLVRSGDTNGARSKLKSGKDNAHWYLQDDVQFESLFLDSTGSTRQILQEMGRHLSTNSAYRLTRLGDEAVRMSKGSFRVEGYIEALNAESHWLPALYGRVCSNRGSWSVATNEGATALELLEMNSELAARVISQLPHGEKTTKETQTDKCSQRVLEAYHGWLKEEGLWSKEGEGLDRFSAVLLYHAGKSTDALRIYEAQNQENRLVASSSFYRLARFYEENGRQTDATSVVQMGLKKFLRGNSILLVTGARYAAKRGDVGEAMRLLSQCLAVSPEYPPAHILLSEIEVAQGNKEAAIRACGDTALYCYGWDSNVMKRIDAVLQALVQH